MLILKKIAMFTLVALGFALTAHSANAQTIYSTFENKTGKTVTITDVSWTGSYSPRI
jgi:ABC-type proline/glycine betaine transport system substrate-binding protein